MIPVYVSSSSRGSGKTSVIATVSVNLRQRGHKFAYIKPRTGTEAGGDAGLMKHTFNLAESIETMTPFVEDKKSLADSLKSILNALDVDREVVFVEVPSKSNLDDGNTDKPGAKYIRVEEYTPDLSVGQIAKNAVGLIVNKVPRSRLSIIRTKISESGKILGIIPEERALIGPTVTELADSLNGKFISDAGLSSEPIRNILIGAMTPDHGPEYYARKTDKAVIVDSGRPDMQLATLDTPTKCLVIAGPEKITSIVLRRAKAGQIPLIGVNDSIENVIKKLETTFHNGLSGANIQRTIAAFEKSLDVNLLIAGLGLRV
jgi:BioD-like phosphotransacetylase family protein